MTLNTQVNKSSTNLQLIADLESGSPGQKSYAISRNLTKTEKKKRSNTWKTQKTAGGSGNSGGLGRILKRKSKTGENLGGGANMLVFIYAVFVSFHLTHVFTIVGSVFRADYRIKSTLNTPQTTI